MATLEVQGYLEDQPREPQEGEVWQCDDGGGKTCLALIFGWSLEDQAFDGLTLENGLLASIRKLEPLRFVCDWADVTLTIPVGGD